MKKRVGIAPAIAMNPDIVLYDEPTTGLDPIIAEEINHMIRDLNTKLNVTSVVVTHDMKSALFIANKMAMVHQGKIVAVGTPEEMVHNENPIVRQFISGTKI